MVTGDTARGDTASGPQRTYPLGHLAGEVDPRFTYGLIFDLADLLQQHGYPPPADSDWAHLVASLHRTLYHDQEHPHP
jgi:hypothetical protein